MSAVIETTHSLPMASEQQSPGMTLLSVAASRGAPPEELEKWLALHERWEANRARKAFVVAMSAFKAEPIRILKSKQVSIPGGAKFAHATLADVVDAACAAMARHGLSHNWDVEQDADSVTVTCIITHEAGHSERVTLTAPPDDSGKKNTIQQIASTVTYLQRYTLMSATGLAAKDMDDDAASRNRKPEPPAAPEGYDKWKLDMIAMADNGIAALTATWGESDAGFRRYVIKSDEAWWLDAKAKAARVQVPA